MNELNKQNKKTMAILGICVSVIMLAIAAYEYVSNKYYIYVYMFIALLVFKLIIRLIGSDEEKRNAWNATVNALALVFVLSYVRMKIIGLSIISIIITVFLGVVFSVIHAHYAQKNKDIKEDAIDNNFLKKWPFIVASLSYVVFRNIHFSEFQFLLIMGIFIDIGIVLFSFLASLFPVTLIYMKINSKKHTK
ncbi:MAG: hypothetical protein K6B67_09355 [Lachnospiraceae bacterium]|nr:hypothetical protein [Lachnospiraceae bacterium]